MEKEVMLPQLREVLQQMSQNLKVLVTLKKKRRLKSFLKI
jgi:hypothetical protein